MNKVFTVQIHGHGAGIVRQTVIARSHKAALLAVIESLPDDHAAWQFPGWDVQVFEANQPVIVGGAR